MRNRFRVSMNQSNASQTKYMDSEFVVLRKGVRLRKLMPYEIDSFHATVERARRRKQNLPLDAIDVSSRKAVV